MLQIQKYASIKLWIITIDENLKISFYKKYIPLPVNIIMEPIEGWSYAN